MPTWVRYENKSKQGIITCVECGAEAKRKSGTHQYCPVCKQARRKEQNKQHQQSLRDRRKQEVDETMPVEDWDASVTDDPWKNLMCAVLLQAHVDGDKEFLDDVGDIYANAIRGKDAIQHGRESQKLT